MGRIYFQSLRLAIGLVCLGGSLILASHWFGLVPNIGENESARRRELSEAIAINTAAHVRKQQWVDLRATAESLVDRNQELLSMGVRQKFGTLKVDAGHHGDLWDKLTVDSGGIDAIVVPITLNRRYWGDVELCFRAPDRSLQGAISRHPLLRLLGFFFVTGTIGYTLYVVRVMRVFNTTQVVPERVRQALDTLAEGLLVLDEKANIVLANQAFAETVDVPVEMLVETGANVLPWIVDGDSAGGTYPWMVAIEQNTTVTEKIMRLQTEDGSARIFSVNAAPIGASKSKHGALATFRDVTHIEEHRQELESTLVMLRDSQDEIEEKNRELEILATQDTLTGCLNRRAFFERFAHFWSLAGRRKKPLSCIMIDNDHFKRINDTYGHSTGDEVLRVVSRVLHEQHGETGLVCRYGGEEFCVLLPNVDLESAARLADQTRKAIEAITFTQPEDLQVTASIGVSETRFGASDPQDLINQADISLYVAKRGGRNRVVCYNPDLELVDTGGSTRSERSDIPYQAVTALLASLSYRDASTAQHSRRVADLCARVSEEFLDPDHRYVLEIAALLHDIGKIGVPDNVLLKRGKLTDEELELIAQHERLGVELIASAFDCDALTEMVQFRRAYYDGSQSEHDLPSGSSIPIGARILSICDSYDSMVTDHVYRAGFSHEEAIDELMRNAGTQFDPRLVEHFAAAISVKPDLNGMSNNSETAIQIGFQVERLVAAIDSHDAESTMTLSSRLGDYARKFDLETVAFTADNIRQHAGEEEVSWIDLLEKTNDLIECCRDAQKNLLEMDASLRDPLAV